MPCCVTSSPRHLAAIEAARAISAGTTFNQADPSKEEIIMLNPSRIASRAAGACALALALVFPAHAVPVLEMSAATTATGVDLTVSARDIADLYAYQFTLNFDPALLNAIAGTEGSFLPNAGPTFFHPGDIDNAAGSVTLALGTLLGPVGGVSGSGGLATFSFGVKQVGFASFRLSDALLLDSTGAVMTADTRDLVAAVPEPASFWLAAAGLFVILGRRTMRPRTS
jgi:hypothetical protein